MLLEVRDLQAYFFTATGVVRAVDGVTYSVQPGETVALVGEAGCGKSGSAFSIMRLVSAPAGRIVGGQILLQGRNLLALDDDSMRRMRGHEIAMIFQEPMTCLNPVLSIGRQLMEPLEIHLGMPPEQARQRAMELLTTVGIPDSERRLRQYPHQFSGGMRQRLMIAMALSCHPALVLLRSVPASTSHAKPNYTPKTDEAPILQVHSLVKRFPVVGAIAVADCAQVVPDLREVEPGHRVVCIRV